MSSHYIPYTKIPSLVFPTSAQASRHVALMIESLIRQNNSANRPTVLGLATGSTPVGLYRELIDAITPWIAQQTGFQLGFISTLILASFGWIGVRAMTWFLFGRFGTPALSPRSPRHSAPNALPPRAASGCTFAGIGTRRSSSGSGGIRSGFHLASRMT